MAWASLFMAKGSWKMVEGESMNQTARHNNTKRVQRKPNMATLMHWDTAYGTSCEYKMITSYTYQNVSRFGLAVRR